MWLWTLQYGTGSVSSVSASVTGTYGASEQLGVIKIGPSGSNGAHSASEALANIAWPTRHGRKRLRRGKVRCTFMV